MTGIHEPPVGESLGLKDFASFLEISPDYIGDTMGNGFFDDLTQLSMFEGMCGVDPLIRCVFMDISACNKNFGLPQPTFFIHRLRAHRK